MSNSDWAPSESAAAIFFERCILAGWFIGAVGFGVHLTLFIWCFHLLYFKKKQLADWFQLIYICLLFTLGNIGNATTIKYAEIVYINARNYPGGPSVSYLVLSSTIIPAVCNSSYIVNTWLQDGLLLYRFWVIYGGNWYFVIPPGIVFLASVVFAVFLIVELSHPGITLWSKISIDLAIPSWSISIALNVILTMLIVARLMYMRHRLRKVLGNRSSDYLSITAMLVESTAIFTLNGIWFIVPYALDSPVQHLALPLLGQTQSIAPLLVILRVLQGRAWSKKTMVNLNNSAPSEIQFRGPASDHIFGGHHEESTIALEAIQDSKSMDVIVTRALKESDTTSDFRVNQAKS